MKTFELTGFYGGSQTPCTIFTAEIGFKTWYVVEGSKNVNCTYDEVRDGVDVEEITDFDVFTSSKPINSCEDLEASIEE